MAAYRCEPCCGLFVESPTSKTQPHWYPHHRTLFELKCCAESHQAQCSVCQLLLKAIQSWTGDKFQCYLNRQEKTDVYNPQLFLRIILGEDVPHSPPYDPLGGLRARINDNTQCIRVYVNRITSNFPYTELGAVEISVPSSSVAARELRGRNARESTSDQHNERTAIAENWLQRCYTHDRCLGKIQAPLPKRLIDLREQNPKLIENPTGTHGVYATLSYYWGHDHGMYKLVDPEDKKPGNINELKKEIEIDKMRASQRHGIQIARELGYEYIWIDAFCIIQNNSADWAKQSSLMIEIYGYADLTIVAGRSKHSNEGFLKHPRQPQPSKVQLEYRSPAIKDKVYCDLDVLRSLELGPAMKRGWCFQEGKISRRRLIYGMEQLSFKCRDYHVFESGHWEPHFDADPWYDFSFLPRLRQQRLSKPPKPSQRVDLTMDGLFSSVIRRPPILQSWYEMTSEFSSLKFYDPRDNHAALSSMVLEVKKALAEDLKINVEEQGVYMAGLWGFELPVALLWRSSRINHPYTPALETPVREENGTPVRRAPSWSWMRLCGAITQGMHAWGSPENEVVLPGEVICASAEPDGTWGPQPDAWHPLMVQHKNFPNPFRLSMKAYICEVCILHHAAQVFKSFGDWRRYSFKNLQQHTVPLEVVNEKDLSKVHDNTPPEFPRIGARGLFDRAYETQWPPKIWAMCITTSEGLLLQKTTVNGAVEYERLGIFAVERMVAFYPESSLDGIGTEKCRVIDEKLEKQTLVLI